MNLVESFSQSERHIDDYSLAIICHIHLTAREKMFFGSEKLLWPRIHQLIICNILTLLDLYRDPSSHFSAPGWYSPSQTSTAQSSNNRVSILRTIMNSWKESILMKQKKDNYLCNCLLKFSGLCILILVNFLPRSVHFVQSVSSHKGHYQNLSLANKNNNHSSEHRSLNPSSLQVKTNRVHKTKGKEI